MIITGIIIIAVAVILMILNFAFIIGSAAYEKDTGIGIGIIMHFLMGIACVVGFAVTAIGIVKELT